MKRAILLSVLLIGMIGYTFAQTATIAVPAGDTYVTYNTDKGIGNGADVWYKIIGNQHTPSTQDLIIHLDSLKGGSMTTTVQLLGTKFTTEGWSAIGSTITWKATTGDTTIVMSNATAARWRDYKVLIHVASGDSVRFDYFKFKLHRE